jgi:hypothetical protein
MPVLAKPEVTVYLHRAGFAQTPDENLEPMATFKHPNGLRVHAAAHGSWEIACGPYVVAHGEEMAQLVATLAKLGITASTRFDS